jgi:hypothetical protein
VASPNRGSASRLDPAGRTERDDRTPARRLVTPCTELRIDAGRRPIGNAQNDLRSACAVAALHPRTRANHDPPADWLLALDATQGGVALILSLRT